MTTATNVPDPGRDAPAADRLLGHVRQRHGSAALGDAFSVSEVWF
jgi:hypothetical protein